MWAKYSYRLWDRSAHQESTLHVKIIPGGVDLGLLLGGVDVDLAVGVLGGVNLRHASPEISNFLSQAVTRLEIPFDDADSNSQNVIRRR